LQSPATAPCGVGDCCTKEPSLEHGQ
jgi:hypothetical protein